MDWDLKSYPLLKVGIAVGPRRLASKGINGTVGLIVDYDKKRMIVSCYHVLVADKNHIAGDPIAQPSGTDNIVAKLFEDKDLTPTTDFGFAEIINPDKAVNSIQSTMTEDLNDIQLLRIAEKSEIEDLLDMKGAVTKRGIREPTFTTGTIVNTDADVRGVEYELLGEKFDLSKQLEIKEENGGIFSKGGDSGSLVTTRSGLMIGMIVAGNEVQGGSSYATPLRFLLRHFPDIQF